MYRFGWVCEDLAYHKNVRIISTMKTKLVPDIQAVADGAVFSRGIGIISHGRQ